MKPLLTTNKSFHETTSMKPLLTTNPKLPLTTHIPIQPSTNFLLSFTKPLTFQPLKPNNINPTLTTITTQSSKSHKAHFTTKTQDDGIPIDCVKTLVKFKSHYNYIRVLEVSRRADHPFRGSRLLLLDGPGNIHSISFLFKTFTETYFDVFATLPPVIPPGPIGILGFGAGSAAKLFLELYPDVVIHGWELDKAVIDVGREYFGLSKLEKGCKNRVFITIGDGLNANLRNGFAGILVDLFSNGSLLPELQDPATWRKLKMGLRKGGRIMVNVGGSCVEAEDSERDGNVVMEETLKAMYDVFPSQVSVLRLGNNGDDSSVAITGFLPDLIEWKKKLPKPLRGYVDMWTPFGE